ncbi:MAG: hypothetical protein ACOYJK_10985 [Prevotella sp.]|jgi:hypothetical protein
MKEVYQKPTLQVIAVRMQQLVMGGSGTGTLPTETPPGETFGITPEETSADKNMWDK